MHDWTLISISVDWEEGIATMSLRNTPSNECQVVVRGLVMLKVPRLEEWGPSTSVNGISGPKKTPTGSELITVEMQSGDVIEIEGTHIDMPTTDE